MKYPATTYPAYHKALVSLTIPCILVSCIVDEPTTDDMMAPVVREEYVNPYAVGGSQDVPLAGSSEVESAGNSIGGDEIMQAGEIQAGEIQAGEIQAGEMMAGEIQAGEIQAGEMQAGEMQAGEMQAGEMQAGEMQAGEMQAGEVIVYDCADTPNGMAYIDQCGVCDTDPSNDCQQDCMGIWGGMNSEDQCGICDADPSNDCTQDCAGDWGGQHLIDECGVCTLPNESTCMSMENSIDVDEIIEIGGFQSGETTPVSCVDGELSMGELAVDCGGICAPCGEVSDEMIAVRIATYYQATLFDSFMMKKIYQFIRQDQTITVHYGYARNDDPTIEAGQDSRTFTIDMLGQIIAHGEHLSGEIQAPLTCADGILNNDETMLDCGGSCMPCNSLNLANIGLQIKNYYDLEGPWAGTYKLGDLVMINFVENTSSIDALYGYINPAEPTNILGYDSRRFEY